MLLVALRVRLHLCADTLSGIVDDFHLVAIAGQHLCGSLVTLAAVVVEEYFLHTQREIMVAPLPQVWILAAHNDAHRHVFRPLALHLNLVLIALGP